MGLISRVSSRTYRDSHTNILYKYHNKDTLNHINMTGSVKTLFVVFLLITSLNNSDAGPIAAGSAVALCYTACNAAYVSCMAASGLVAGTTGPVGWIAWLTSAAATCSAGQGVCMTACTAVGLGTAVAPTP